MSELLVGGYRGQWEYPTKAPLPSFSRVFSLFVSAVVLFFTLCQCGVIRYYVADSHEVPIEQMSHACETATSGMLVISSQAYEFVRYRGSFVSLLSFSLVLCVAVIPGSTFTYPTTVIT